MTLGKAAKPTKMYQMKTVDAYHCSNGPVLTVRARNLIFLELNVSYNIPIFGMKEEKSISVEKEWSHKLRLLFGTIAKFFFILRH